MERNVLARQQVLRMKRFVGIGLAALLAGACTELGRGAPPEARRTGRVAQAIIGGTPSIVARDAIVQVNEDGYGGCTGALIAPNLVLTARHCVTHYNDWDECGLPLGPDLSPSLYTVSYGVYPGRPNGESARGTRLYLPSSTTGLCSADIALIQLDADVTNVTPIAVGFAMPKAGQALRAIGYGGGLRTERAGVTVLALGPSKEPYRTATGQLLDMRLTAGDFATTESACDGDSGGPLLDESGAVIAVVSRGLADGQCIDRPTVWTATAAHETLVREAARGAGHPLPAAAPAPPDPSPARPASEAAAERDADDAEGGAMGAASDGGCAAAGAGFDAGSGVALALAITLASRARRTRRRPAPRSSSGCAG